MTPASVLRRAFAPLLSALLTACAAAPSSSPGVVAEAAALPFPGAADYAALAAAGGNAYALDPATSKVLIYAYRGGRAAASGHNHVIAARVFRGWAYVPAKTLAGARFDIEVPLEGLSLDEPELRAATGGGFAGELSADDIAGTRAHLLGARGLDAARYPFVRLSADEFAGELPRPVAALAITLHGQTHRQLLPLQVIADADRLEARGAFALRQTDFGATPYSVLGGLLSVQDEVSVEFTLVGRALRS